MPVVGGERKEVFVGFEEKRLQIRLLDAKNQPVAVRAGEGEELLEHVGHLRALPCNHLKKGLLFCGGRLFTGGGVGEDDGKRCAQFVGNAGDKAVLAFLGSEQRLQKPSRKIPAEESEEAEGDKKQGKVEKQAASDTGVKWL